MSRHLTAALILSIALFAAAAFAQEGFLEVKPAFKAGAGYGPTYGGIGVNFETSLVEYVGVAAGIGYTSAGTGWAAGVRAYPLGNDRWLNPRLAIYRSVVGVIEKAGEEDRTHVDNAYGFGLDLRINAPGGERADILDFELLLVEDDLPDGYRLKGGKVKFSIGYGFRF